jgi:iron complex outermembrane receptor protein
MADQIAGGGEDIMTSTLMITVARGALVAAAVTMPSVAIAQAAPPAASLPAARAPGASPKPSDLGIGEIIVTARKREESLQKVPLAVTAITTEQLRERSIKTPYDLTSSAPGLNLRSGGGTRESPDYFLRGQGNTFQGNPAVVTYFNDVPLGSLRQNIAPAVANLQLYDLANVQVLKGPQGTLFGKSSTGGAVLFTPIHPKNEFGGYLDAQVGNYDMREFQGALNVPVIKDVLSLRLAGDIVRRRGFTQSQSTGQYQDQRHREGYRLGINFTPTSWLSSYTLLQQLHAREVPSSGVISDVDDNFPLLNSSVTVNPLTAFTPAAIGAFFAQSFNTGGDSVVQLCTAQGLGLIAGGTGPGGIGGCVAARTARIADLKTQLDDELARVQNGGSKRKNLTTLDDLQRFKTQSIQNTTTIDVGDSPLGKITLKNIFSTQRVLQNSVIREFGVSSLPSGVVINQYDIVGTYPNQQITPYAPSEKSPFKDNFTEEFQIQGNINNRHSWVIGYFLNKAKFDQIGLPPIFESFNNAFTTPNLDQLNFLFPTTVLRGSQAEMGYFGQFTADLSSVVKGLHLTGGFRWSRDYTKQQSVAIAASPTGVVILPPDPANPVTQTPTYREHAPSYTIAIDYQLKPNLLVYITHRRGFKPGGVNSTSSLSNIPGIRATYDPETLKDVEAGFKSDWRIGGVRGRTNLAAYYSWYSNIQRSEVLTIPPSLGGGVTTQTNNIAAAEIGGVEIENNIRFARGLTGFLNYAYTHAKYTRYPGVTVDDRGGIHQNIDSPYIGTPRHQLTIGARYALPIDSSHGEIALSGDYYRQSSIELDDSALQDVNNFGKQKAYGDFNLRVDWNGVEGTPIDLAFFIRNVTNEIHLVGYGSQIASTGYAFGTYNEPRMFGIEARFRFGSDAR